LFSINLITNTQNKTADYNKLKATVAQLSSKVRLLESSSINDTLSTKKKILVIGDKIDSLESEIKIIESSQKKK
jgi:hypothetical protein